MDELEIEVKAYCDDHELITNALHARGAVFVSSHEEEDLYFNHPSKDYAQTDEALRIRKVNGRSILTYKGPKIGSRAKSRVEKEVVVDDFAAMSEILELLDFVKGLVVKKKRDIFRISDVEICLENVEGLGHFVELEKKGSDRIEIEKELLELAEELGLKSFERKSYLEMIIETRG